MDTLSSQAPNCVWVPCIAIDAGPRKVEADAYNKDTKVVIEVEKKASEIKNSK